MATNLRRTSLFNRRFALSRKAAQSLPAGRTSIRQDAEGFDDLDEYFAASPAKPRVLEKSWEVTETSTSTTHPDGGEEYVPPTVDEYGGGDFGGAVLGPDEVLVDVHGGDDDDVNNDNDYRENHDQSNTRPYAGDDRGEEDPEVSFKSTLKVTRSPREDVDSSPARDTKRTTLSQRTRSTRAPSRRGVRSGLEPLVDLKTSTSGMGEAHDFYRRSKRQKIAPLAFWRNEKVIYGRRQSARMPVIVDVLRKDAAQSPTKQPARHQSSRQKKKRAIEAEGKLREVGFRPKVSVEAAVIDYDTHELTQRRTPLALLFIDDTCWLLVLALGSDQVKAKTVNGEDFAIQTIFTEGTFLSSGILEFPPKSSKPSRNSSKHVLVFFVIEGSLEVTINETQFIVGTGCQFIVPRGNQYSIRSVWNKTSRLFFCHCKNFGSNSSSENE